jgi:hypothetical protein
VNLDVLYDECPLDPNPNTKLRGTGVNKKGRLMGQFVMQGMYGLGDNFYMIPVVREAIKKWKNRAPLILRTPWPQLWRSQFIKEELLLAPTGTSLRTQLKNEHASREYYDMSFSKAILKFDYCRFHGKGDSVWEGLQKSLNVKGPYHLSLKDHEWVDNMKTKTAIIRPCTLREEWSAPSRNCKPKYIQYAIDQLNEMGYNTIVIADIEKGKEKYEGGRPKRAHIYYEKGQLSLMDMMYLFSTCSIAVGPVGFIVPMSIAIGTPSVILHGGAGGWNAPNLIQAPGRGKPIHVTPTNHCLCKNINIIVIKKYL